MIICNQNATLIAPPSDTNVLSCLLYHTNKALLANSNYICVNLSLLNIIDMHSLCSVKVISIVRCGFGLIRR